MLDQLANRVFHRSLRARGQRGGARRSGRGRAGGCGAPKFSPRDVRGVAGRGSEPRIIRGRTGVANRCGD
ncbi:hypothetical protein CSC33_4357 [Pseudomonas aeruginosa]|nr:hypothetical protein CSC33_4357 [Pseudomonas aeruginosa]